MHSDVSKAQEFCNAEVIRGALERAECAIRGRFRMECFAPDGKSRWVEEFDNLVTTEGKNFILDTVLAGSGYSVAGPFLGLISSSGWSAVAAGDTMASHSGWTEAGTVNAPAWTTPASGARQTTAWSAAAGGAKGLSAVAAFSISSAGTVKGCFLCSGAGAVATAMSPLGKLVSAGTFTAGDKTVGGHTLNVSYSLALT